jgi:hypothetical protein
VLRSTFPFVLNTIPSDQLVTPPQVVYNLSGYEPKQRWLCVKNGKITDSRRLPPTAEDGE